MQSSEVYDQFWGAVPLAKRPRDIPTELLAQNGLAGVFYDLTHKSPATIGWE